MKKLIHVVGVHGDNVKICRDPKLLSANNNVPRKPSFNGVVANNFSKLVDGLAKTKVAKMFARVYTILVEEAYAYLRFRCGKVLKFFNHIQLI